jgi:hypothetical protein
MATRNFPLTNTGYVQIALTSHVKVFGQSKARLINKIEYWAGKGMGVMHEGRRFVSNSARAWGEQICLSERQTSRIVQDLIKDGVLIVKTLAKNKSNRTNYYAINYERLCKLDGSRKGIDSSANSLENVSDIETQCLDGYTRNTYKEKEEGSLDVPPRSLPVLIENKEEGEIKEFIPEVKPTTQNRVEPVKTAACSTGLAINRSKSYPTRSNKTIPMQMMDIVKEECTDLVLTMKENRERYLWAAYNHKFDKNLEKFRDYCKKLPSIAYKIGESIIASLEDAVNFKKIDAVMGISESMKANAVPSEQQFEKKALDHIVNVQESERCKEDRNLIRKILGNCAYVSWFTQVQFEEIDGFLHMNANNKFIEHEINVRFGHLLNKILS